MSEIFGETAIPIPDVAEPIKAYRAWSVHTAGLLGYGDTIWPRSQPIVATCVRQHMPYYLGGAPRTLVPHDAPSATSTDHDGYGCGIYAYKTLDACMAEQWVDGGSQLVFGEVLLWGTVYEHKNGYRASHAKVAAIYDLPHRGCMVGPAEIAAFYDVPLVESEQHINDLNYLARQRDEARAARMKHSSGTFFVTTTVTIDDGTNSTSGTVRMAKRRRSWSMWFYAAAGAVTSGLYIIGGRPLFAGIWAASAAISAAAALLDERNRHRG